MSADDAGVRVRPEAPSDFEQVARIHELAFGGPGEARLVERLRVEATPLVSLVSEQSDSVEGHILFSPVTVGAGSNARPAMGLAPVGVLPERQGAGLGSQLVRAGFESCRALGQNMVVVLGHPSYYPRFGFEPAYSHGIYYRSESLEPAFMVVALVPGALEGYSGRVEYHPAFSEL